MNERKMDELLAWYVNGTLSDEERQQVEAWLEANPEARLQLAEYQFMHDSIGEEGAEEPQFDTESGLNKLMARIEQEEAANETPPDTVSNSLVNRVAGWFNDALQWNLTPAFARVAMVSQLGVVMVLGALLLIPGESDPGYQVLSGSPPTNIAGMAEATIGVKPETSLAQFQRLLREQEATIIAGPSAIGTYRIRLTDNDQLEARLAALKDDPAVTYLERVMP